MENDIGEQDLDPSNLIFANRRAVMGEAVTSLEDDPAKAGRAFELGKATGDKPALVYANLENFEAQHKAALTAQLLSSNDHLRQYISADPMHAKVSNDDWANLDDASEKVKALHQPSAFERWLKSDSIAREFKEGFGDEPLGQHAFKTKADIDFAISHPFLASVAAIPAMVGDIMGRPIGGLLNVIAGETGSREIPAMLEWLMMRGDIGGGVGGGGAKAVNSALHNQILEALPIVESHVRADEIPPRGIHSIIDRIHDEQARHDVKALKDAETAVDKTATKERSADSIEAFIKIAGQRDISITPDAVRRLYGEEIPHAEDGLLGMVPGLAEKLVAAEESGADVRVPLTDWLARVEPEVRDQLRDDIRFRPEGVTKVEAETVKERKEVIEASTDNYHSRMGKMDAERATYEEDKGDWRVAKAGASDDPLYQAIQGVTDTGLSFEKIQDSIKWALENNRPDIAQAGIDRLQRHATSSSKSTPGVAKDSPRYKKIEEDLAERAKKDQAEVDRIAAEHGLKVSEDVAPKRPSKPAEPLPEHLPQLRAHAALEPLYSIGDRKLELKRSAKQDEGPFGRDHGFHNFDLLDQNGKTSGYINISEQKDGKQLYIDMIEGGKSHPRYGFIGEPNFFGPALMRDLYRQIKAEFPKAFGPDGLGITGHRVSGAREKAGTYMEPHAQPVIKADMSDVQAGEALRQLFADHEYKPLSDVLEAAYKPTELLTEREHELSQAIGNELARLIPKQVEVSAPSAVRQTATGRDVHGAHISYTDRNPFVIISIDGPHPVGTAQHEAIHHLRQQGFFTEGEWSTLERAARDNGWIEKFGIERKYEKLDTAAKLEEAIAEGFRDWKKGNEVPPAAATIFERLKQLFENIHARLKEIFGREVSWEELFQKVDTGEVGGREGNAPRREGAYKESVDEPELPGVTRMEDRAPFARDAVTTKGRHDRYMRLINERHEADIAASERRIAEDQRLRQTKEWKANRAELRKEVSLDIRDRPDVAADLFFGAKELYGEPIEKQKLDAAKLTEEQKASLPRDYYGKDGINPDDAARLFGYESGDLLVNRLAAYNDVKLAAGMSAKDFLTRVTDIETDRRMELRYGNLERNIIEDTREQVLSENQLNILHEETYRLATEAGLEFTFTKDQMKAQVRENFSKLPVGEVSAKDFLRASGKYGQAAEDALLKDDPAAAFKAKQVQTYSNIYAAEALKVEKAKKQLDRTAKTFRKALVPSVEAEYTNHIQDILQRAGYKINRSVQNIEENIANKAAKNVEEFAQQKLAESYGLREIPVAEILEDPNFRKPIAEMTVEEFRQFKQTVDALVANGRNEMKVIRDGEAHDLAEVKAGMIEQVRTFPLKAYTATKSALQRKLDLPRVFMAGSTNMETLFNRLDRDNPRGIWNKFVTYPMAKAANYESRLQREYSKPYGELEKIVDGDKLVAAPFVDPLSITPSTPAGIPWTGFTRKNVLAMLQNAGNKSNWNVLARGYGADPEALMNWLVRNTTPEDWARAQKMGDTIFKSLIKQADGVYERLNGITVDKIPLEPIENAHGTFDGWYHPLIADPIRRGKQKVRGGAYEDGDYGHASTANGYTKARTGTVYPLDLNFDMVPQRMKQMIHDIAFRETILETQKLFKDPAIHNALTQHYGEHYSDLLMPYLRAIAGAESIPSKAGGKAAQVSEFLRQNTISTYIGFNPYTALKHGPTAAIMSSREVGTRNFIPAFFATTLEAAGFARAAKALYGQSPELGLMNSEFAMKWSEELQRRERHWQDTIAGQHKEIEGAQTLRESVIEKGSWLVAKSDMLSAKPTWVARYNSAIEEGSSHGEAIDLADRAVRNAHGSTAVTNQPALVRGGGPLHGWLTSVYGFFGTAMQRRIEIAHKLNDAYQLGKEGEIKAAASLTPGILADVFTYVIWPTMVEEWVTGLTTDDKRGWGEHLIAGTFLGLSSSVLYLRDFAHAMVTGHDPGVGLLSSPLHDVANAVRDIKHGREAFSRQRAGKTVGDLMTVFGEGTGMSPKTVANATHFGIDLVNGQSHPKTFTDWRMGVTRGKTDKRIER